MILFKAESTAWPLWVSSIWDVRAWVIWSDLSIFPDGKSALCQGKMTSAAWVGDWGCSFLFRMSYCEAHGEGGTEKINLVFVAFSHKARTSRLPLLVTECSYPGARAKQHQAVHWLRAQSSPKSDARWINVENVHILKIICCSYLDHVTLKSCPKSSD